VANHIDTDNHIRTPQTTTPDERIVQWNWK